ncbi:multiprotein-bridging factor 1 family protein [Streptomyces sp. NPDC059788]|uniref:helix-turn-helix domain-containing protein n=1 Tax=Streptomyces sp. NPDC059788 TaxID=3346948 RepID=UPI00365E0437
MADHHGARVARGLAVLLTVSLEVSGWSVAELSRRSGVSRLTITNVLGGRVWPDLLTIANLELALDLELWPGLMREAGTVEGSTQSRSAGPEARWWAPEDLADLPSDSARWEEMRDVALAQRRCNDALLATLGDHLQPYLNAEREAINGGAQVPARRAGW